MVLLLIVLFCLNMLLLIALVSIKLVGDVIICNCPSAMLRRRPLDQIKYHKKVLTISSEALTVPLTNLINHCITINAWPSLWKHSNVSPVYKKDSPTDKVNYRPVSVLTCFPKIFERVLHDQMLDFAKLIRSDSLSGLLKGDSCATVLLKMTDDFRASLNNKDHCTAIAEDVSKAFDSISHSLLISKLKAYGFTESTVTLIRSYLCDRLQRVKIGNTY